MSAPDERPLLFLDVDGPLLPFGEDPEADPWERAMEPPLARLRPDVGPRLAALPCRLVWATAWEDRANTDLAPVIGLPRLPVVNWPEPSMADELEDDWLGLCWKTRSLVAWAAGRPFAWVDDEITDADRQWVASHHAGPALLRHIEPSRGLTEQDFEALDRWLGGPRTAEP